MKKMIPPIGIVLVLVLGFFIFLNTRKQGIPTEYKNAFERAESYTLMICIYQKKYIYDVLTESEYDENFSKKAGSML